MQRTPERPDRCFVGREDLLQRIGALLGEPGRGYRLQARGTWGIGKSWFIEEVRRRSSHMAAVACLRPGERYVPRAEPGAPADANALIANWNAFATLLGDVADAQAPDVSGRLLAQVQLAKGRVMAVRAPSVFIEHFNPVIKARTIETGADSSMASAHISGDEPLHRIVAAVDDAADSLTRAFAEELDRVGSRTGAVLLVDEFDKLSGHVVADWLVRLLTRLDKTVVILTARAAGPEREGDAMRFDSRRLTRFSEQEIREFLRMELGVAAPADDLVRRVHRFSGGLPLGVSLATTLIGTRTAGRGRDDLADIVFHEGRPVTTELLSGIVAEVPDADVALLLRNGRLARRIDVEVAHHLLFDAPYEPAAPSAEQTGRALQALLEYAFIETVDPDDRDGIGRYRFHEYLMRAAPSRSDEALWVDPEHVHGRLAAFYARRRTEFEDEKVNETEYEQWHMVEDPEWQALTREWLYHSSHLRSHEARKAARLEFALTVLRAFWWWGCYVPSEFCEWLVDDWDRTQPHEDDPSVGWLRELLRWYPPGSRKLDRGDWARVEQALRALRDVADVERGVPLEDRPEADDQERRRASNRRWLRVLTSVFLAHSFQFRSGMADLATRHFDDALKYLAAENAQLVEAWTRFERSTLRLALGDLAGCASDLRAAAPVARRENDLELLAALYRLRGDLAMARREDATDVARFTAAAVLRAYAYLLPKPDPYLVAFYGEMRARLAERLDALARERGLAEAETAAETIAELLAPLADAGTGRPDPSVLRGALGRGDAAALTTLMDAVTPAPPALGDAAFADRGFFAAAQRCAARVEDDPADAELERVA